MLKNHHELIKALAEKNGGTNYAYAEAFGFAWAGLSKAAQNRMLKYYSKELKK